MRPIWAICTKSGQKCSRIGEKFNHVGDEVLLDTEHTPLLSRSLLSKRWMSHFWVLARALRQTRACPTYPLRGAFSPSSRSSACYPTSDHRTTRLHWWRPRCRPTTTSGWPGRRIGARGARCATAGCTYSRRATRGSLSCSTT